ncbi:hypothetical protein [Streptomyces sp. NPDC054797]
MTLADHVSAAAPALAEVRGILYCAHGGGVEESEDQPPVRRTSFTPSATQPFVAALEAAGKALPEDATAEQTERWNAERRAAADALEHRDGEAVWAEPRVVSSSGDDEGPWEGQQSAWPEETRQLPLGPALAVYDGALHLVYADPYNGQVRHLVRDAEHDSWSMPTDRWPALKPGPVGT